MIPTSVSTLLLSCGPAAIARFIVAVVVWVAVNLMIWRWFISHIHEEVFESSEPFVADLYAPTTIMLPSWVMGMATPAFHGFIGCVFMGVFFSKMHVASSLL